MAPWLACVREHRRSYEGCRDLHQTQLVLAAVSGGGRGLREREPPSFGPMQADLRTYFEMPEDGQEPRGNHASEAFPCCIAKCRCALQHRALQGWSQEPSRQFRHWAASPAGAFDAISGNQASFWGNTVCGAADNR